MELRTSAAPTPHYRTAHLLIRKPLFTLRSWVYRSSTLSEHVPQILTKSVSEFEGVERRHSPERRRYSLASMRAALLHPRRMRGRRRADRRFPILDRFESGVFTMAVLLMCLSVLDSIFTLTLISRGSSEVNPFMNWLLGYSVWLFVACKMLLTAIPSVVLVATGNLLVFGRLRVRSVLGTLVGVYGALILYEIILLTL